MLKKGSTLPDIFVKKLEGKMGKILSGEALLKIWILLGGSKSRLSYALMRAKSNGILESLGHDLYIIKIPDTPLEFPYWEVAAALIDHELSGEGIIAHEKSMELHLQNFEPPETLIIYTRDRAKRIQIGGYHFHLRSLKSGSKSGGKDMFRYFLRENSFTRVGDTLLRHLSIEASLLDVASLRLHELGMKEDLLYRFFKRYEKKLSREKLGDLVRMRYIRAINRIRSFSKTHGFHETYEKTLDIIKKEGSGCFVSF